MTRRRDVSIYKPNKRGTGSVAQFSLKNDNSCMFLECTTQCRPMDDPKPYDWDSKIIVKLGMADINKLYAYMELNAPGQPLKLYHQSPGGGNKAVEFAYNVYNGRPQYLLKVSAKSPGGEASRVQVPIAMDEAVQLKIALWVATMRILGW